MTGGPTTLLISALGGEGGGVLTGWIVAAAQSQGLAVQATSVPGVPQRTGATTYYIEMAKKDSFGRSPVFALFPVAGQVDILLASELIESARAVTAGYVTPDRTTVIASAHRVYTMNEKTAMGDGRFSDATVRQALVSRAKRTELSDLRTLAQQHGAPIGAALLGALSAAQVLPIPRAAFEEAIRVDGRAVERNLAAFAAACDGAMAEGAPPSRTPEEQTEGQELPFAFPAAARGVIAEGIERLTDYQTSRYAQLYLRRLEPFADGDGPLCRELARALALRMGYEDVIRVAQLKARPDRIERIRGELGLEEDDPFHVADFLKPGVNELCDVLPWVLAAPLLFLARRIGWLGRLHVGMKPRSTTIRGYSQLWLLAKLRFLRRLTYRYGVEQKAIGRWLALIARAAETDAQFAREIAKLDGLIKGYADTAQRGRSNYERILVDLVEPILDGELTAADPAALIATARAKALADPDGNALTQLIAGAAA
jgi:indolepyruvate ferredoxin oxidoreductase beta subunit